MLNATLVKSVAAVVDDLSEDQVRRVLTALEAIRDGAPVGTIVKDPTTGAVALRVSDGGVDCWSVSEPGGGHWRDMQPRLEGWTVVSPGEGGVAK